MSGSPDLVTIIHEAIAAAGGRITFARFMELALYHPQHGYYTRGQPRIGRQGDFFTSVSVGGLFGKILARQFALWRAELGDPAEFQVIEYGGHDGRLRADVLAAAPDLDYRLVEVGDDLPHAVTGCVFSNELLDALPVHRVVVRQKRWQEIYVVGTQDGPGFAETTGPLSTPALAAALADLPVEHMEGYRTEINLRALDWLAAVAARLRRGYLLTFDYGFERAEYFAPHRPTGHLQCYHRHRRHNNPYIHVGDQDLTAHVEFSSLIERGRELGLETVAFTDQAHFLLEAGQPIIAEIVARTAGHISKERQAIHQLIHPGLMGRVFRVLVQRRAAENRIEGTPAVA